MRAATQAVVEQLQTAKGAINAEQAAPGIARPAARFRLGDAERLSGHLLRTGAELEEGVL